MRYIHHEFKPEYIKLSSRKLPIVTDITHRISIVRDAIILPNKRSDRKKLGYRGVLQDRNQMISSSLIFGCNGELRWGG